MTTLAEKEKTSKLVTLLHQVQAELEEYEVQLSLGKMEARDAYAQLQHEFGDFINELRTRWNQAKKITTKRLQEINAKIDELEARLRESKQDKTKEKVLSRLQEVKSISEKLQMQIKDKNGLNEATAVLSYQLQKWVIKLAILELFFTLGKLDIRHKWVEQKEELTKKLEKLESAMKEKKEAAAEWWTHFKDEIEEAFEHMGKAVKGTQSK
jgi:vacuolar-type H+-ATPase catalytic subunit A/Vma1